MRGSLAETVHVAHVAASLTAFLTPRDVVRFVVWAVESDLHDGASQLLAHAPDAGLVNGEEERRHGEWSLVELCAAASGSRNAFQRLMQHGGVRGYVDQAPLREVHAERTLPASVLYEAAKRGDKTTIEWLLPMTDFVPHEAMAFAAANGHVEIARWIGELTRSRKMMELGYELELHGVGSALTWTATSVDASGQRVCHKYFATKQCGLEPICTDRGEAVDTTYAGAMDIVASRGDLALLWAMHEDSEYDWPCSASAMDRAATNGHLRVVQWLKEHRCEGCTQAALDGAARNGHIGVMEWLQDHCKLTPSASTFVAALEGGHIEVLRWMHEHTPGLWSLLSSRCSLVEAACVSPNRLRALQWLEDVKDIRLATKTAVSFVLSQGDEKTAQWLADPTGDGRHLEHWNWVVARWMSFEYALWHNGTFANAAANGHINIVEWLANAGPLHPIDPETLWQCGMRGHLQVVEFLLQRPQHHPKDLVFLPRDWSSFYDSVGEKESYRLGDRCEWDPLGWDPSWAKTYVELWLSYRPAECSSILWLPLWAQRCGYISVHEQLLKINYRH